MVNMKLSDYLMHTAFSECNWNAAFELLRQHFELVKPDHTSYEVIEHKHNARQIEVRLDRKTYYWCESGGFNMTEIRCRGGKNIIYCRPPGFD